MPVDPQTGVWSPRLAPKQLEVFNLKKRYCLVDGPRYSGKTVGTLHRITRHIWEVPARFVIFCKTIKNAKSGVWADLIETVLPEWLDAGLSSEDSTFEFTVPPKIDGATRMHYFRVRNYHGTESEVQLQSLDFDGDVEKVVFGTRYSGFYFSELQHFKDRRVFDATIQQLRMPNIAYEDHFWIADTNPPEEGPDHFAHKIWIEQLNDPDHPDPEFRAQLGRVNFSVDDNPFVDPRVIADLKQTYRHDPEGYDRFVLGKWTRSGGHAEKHFSAIFRPEIHVLGQTNGTDESEWELLNPSSDCRELITGWDLGDNNHAAGILQKRLNDEGKSCFDVLEEQVSIRENLSTEDFTLFFLEHMDDIEAFLGRKVIWRHWSDESAFRFRAGGAEAYDALLVQRVSSGRIILSSVAGDAKKPGGVRKRVELIRQLLLENRLFVSAHCFRIIEMFKEIKKGRKPSDYILKGQDEKHSFDWLSYAIYSELYTELEYGAAPETGRRLISVPL